MGIFDPPSTPLRSIFAIPPAPIPPTTMQWMAVIPRFDQFNKNIFLSPHQELDGFRKRESVVGCLNRHYYSSPSNTDNSFFVGSWGKTTQIRPPRDIDIIFVLPLAVYYRFQSYLGNRQSSLLQEVKGVLQATFPSTHMRGDGQVVMVNFESYNVEVVPAFALQNNRYWICDTNGGGQYKETDPWAEIARIESIDTTNAKNLRPLIRMMKCWQSWCAVPMKSFQLELVASDYLLNCPWRLNSSFYYDWLTRDFFAYLVQQANKYVIVPGTFEPVFLGDAWHSRAQTALDRAVKACEHERYNNVVDAGEEWQKIFGLDIPRTV